MPTQDDPWADAVVISTYTDAQAVEDGVLVKLWDADRCIRAVWEWLCEHLEADQTPEDWPLSLLACWEASTAAGRALAALGGLIYRYEQEARATHEENRDGGILVLRVLLDERGQIVGLRPGKPCPEEPSRRLWLLPNELGGLTVLFPEDY